MAPSIPSTMPEFSRFDRRGYPTVSPQEGYLAWRDSYEDTVKDCMDLALLERIASVPWNELRTAADLGCGTGRTGAWLRAQGVGAIDGIDATPAMLEAARARGIYRRLVERDLSDTGLAPGAYDIVSCCLVDEHLGTLGPLYSESARLLRQGGRLVLVGFHPFFIMNAGMPTHFVDTSGNPVAIETHVHLLGDHVSSAAAAGLGLVELHEALIDESWLSHKPGWREYLDWPFSFAAVWRRSTNR